MANTPNMSRAARPYQRDVGQMLAPVSAEASFNVGDFMVWEGSAVVPTALSGNAAVTDAQFRAFRASAAGIAFDSNPVADHFGVTRYQDEVLLGRACIVKVSALWEGKSHHRQT